MQLKMTHGSRSSSSDSETGLDVVLGSPSSANKQRGAFTLSSALMEPLVNYDTWPMTTGTSPKSGMMPQRATKGMSRGRLPSIEEIHPAAKLYLNTAGRNNLNTYTKRKNPQGSQKGGRPIRDRIIKHSLSESHLRARVEPLSEDGPGNQPLVGSRFLETAHVWSTSGDPASVHRQTGVGANMAPSDSLSPHRETVTIDGKVRRVRFLSADHTPLKDDPSFRNLLIQRGGRGGNRGTAPEAASRTRHTDEKRMQLRSVTVSGRRKSSLDEGVGDGGKGGGDRTYLSKMDEKKESPDVWLERARKLRASKDKLNNNHVTHAESITLSKQSESIKFHEDEDWDACKPEDTSSTAIKHVNYCDEKKTQWVVRWLTDVNRQSHFDIIE